MGQRTNIQSLGHHREVHGTNKLTSIPKGYFTEETVKHLRPRRGLGHKHRMRALETMLACQLTLTYGRYHIMMDLRQLTMSEEHMSYQQSELMVDILNQKSLIETNLQFYYVRKTRRLTSRYRHTKNTDAT